MHRRAFLALLGACAVPLAARAQPAGRGGDYDRALGLTLPPSLVARADRVIE